LLGDRRTSSFYSPIADNVLSVKRSSALHRLNSHRLESSGGSHTSANQSEGSGTRSQPRTMFYSAVKVVLNKFSVVDPHHLDADPDSTYHSDADPVSDFYLMRIRIRFRIFI
jgi:hypothetical protein